MRDAIDRVYRQALLMIGLGRITAGPVPSSAKVQRLQIALGSSEIHDNEIRFSEYGFASSPLPGCNTISVYIAGDRANGAIIATNDPNFQVTLQPGESVLFDNRGRKVHLTQTETLIEGGSDPIIINTTGDVILTAGGTVQLGAAGGKKVVLDGDPVSGGTVHASSSKVTAT